MRHETYIDVLKSVFLTVACLVFFPLLLPAISPSQDPNGVPENLLIIGEEEAERSASISMADSLSGVYAEANGAPENLLIFGEEEAEQSASIHHVDSLSDASSDDWYIPAVIPNELRAPMRASATGCLTDSILTFNQDSVLTEATTYDYDAAGRTIRTTVWQYNAEGSRTGKSKQEYAFDANGTQIYTGTFAWDAATNDWKGTAKSEYVYNEAHKMESNITYTWVNNTWLPSQALTYAYDAAGRETEFTTYARNASLNRLVPSKQRLQTWYNASKKTLEINYTAYANGAWSAGTKKEYAYDASGNQIEYTYFSSYAGNGNWVGSTHELWTYNTNNKKTYYKKETWTNNEWKTSNEEFTDYDTAGNTTRVENYALKNGVLSGSKKETYTFNSAKKKTGTITYKWSNGEWVNNIWTVSGYDAAGNANETCKYNWKNDTWVGTGTRTLKTYNSNKKITEKITQTWPSGATDWVNATRNTTTYTGAKTTQEASYTWQNDAWVGTTRSDWHYNAAGQNDTIKTYTNNGTDWTYSARTVNTYNENGVNILTHNSSWNGITWLLVSMTRTDIIKDVAGHELLNAQWSCSSDSVWVGVQKDTATYSSTNKMLYWAHYTSWANDDWVPSYKQTFVYDEADRMLINERYNWISNQWQGSFRYEYGYDEQGRQTYSATYNSWSSVTSSWVGTTMTETMFNEVGQTVEKKLFNWGISGWDAFNRYLYTYNAEGRLIDQVVQSYCNNDWQNAMRYEKGYLGGTEIKSNTYAWIDEAWQITSRSEKEYDLDSQAKMRRDVSGTWNNSGVVQSFSDNHYFYSCDAPADNNGAQPRTPTELEEIDENNGNYENYDTNVQPFDPMLPTYNLQGQSVDPATYHGIVIQNGKKYVL